MKKFKISPIVQIIIGFLIIIVIGMFLLKLPIATNEDGLTWVDAFFISVSSVCITGLSPVLNLAETLTTFGKVVTVILIQVGGLGFVTVMTFFFMIFGAKIGISNRYLIKESLNQNDPKGIIRLVRDIILMTLVFELIGTVINLIVFSQDYHFPSALGISVYHAISAFNNCGLDIIGANSLIGYSHNVLLCLNTSFLVIFGGIGFIVIRDILVSKMNWKKFSIHTKIVLKTSGLLILFGTLLLLLSEIKNPEFGFLQAFTQAVCARTAGFATVSFATLNSISIFLISILMFIGASPSSTGGGIKTTTFYTAVRGSLSFVRRRPAFLYGRKIAEESKVKAFALIMIAVVIVLVGTMFLLVIEYSIGTSFKVTNEIDSNLTAAMALLEVISAFGTVGYSVGVTPLLHPLSKILLCLIMYLGRLGPLTVLSIMNIKGNKTENNIKYMEERIIIG